MKQQASSWGGVPRELFRAENEEFFGRVVEQTVRPGEFLLGSLRPRRVAYGLAGRHLRHHLRRLRLEPCSARLGSGTGA